MVARLAPVAGSIAARAIVWSVISLSLEATGATPRERASRPGAEQGSTCAEAPRPAHDRIDGRSPGSRVGARRRLPGITQWLLWRGLAAYSCGGSCGLGDLSSPAAFPVRSHVRDRRSRPLNGPRGCLVNAGGFPGLWPELPIA